MRKQLVVAFISMFFIGVAGAEMTNIKLPFNYGESWKLSCGYGCGMHQGDDYYSLDFTLPNCSAFNKSILAVAPGRVEIQKEDSDGYGKCVTVFHGDGFVSRYAHLSSILVENNQWVHQGQEIGRCGNTGYWISNVECDHPGTHLHFTLYFNGDKYKPEPMSEYTNFTINTWYISDNHTYQEFVQWDDYCKVYKPNFFVERFRDKKSGLLKLNMTPEDNRFYYYCENCNLCYYEVYNPFTEEGGYFPHDFGDENISKGPDANVKKVELDATGNNWHHTYTAYAGSTLQARITINNKGDESIDYFEVYLYRSSDKDFDRKKDYSFGREEEEDNLKPGDKERKRRTINVPNTPGVYYIFAYINKVEGKNNGTDQNWSNNYSRDDDPEEYAVLIVEAPPPTADFTFSPNTGMVPLTIKFSNTSRFADSYFWTFGDGSATNAANPTYTYAKAGNYTITLKAGSRLGTSQKTATVSMLAVLPVQSFNIINPTKTDKWRCEKNSQSKNIRWTSQNISQKSSVAIYYTYDGGNNWLAIDKDTSNDGSKNWEMCRYKTNDSKNCYIKIVLNSNPAIYAVSQKFAIDHARGCK